MLFFEIVMLWHHTMRGTRYPLKADIGPGGAEGGTFKG